VNPFFAEVLRAAQKGCHTFFTRNQLERKQWVRENRSQSVAVSGEEGVTTPYVSRYLGLRVFVQSLPYHGCLPELGAWRRSLRLEPRHAGGLLAHEVGNGGILGER